jgi:hypothetical protein
MKSHHWLSAVGTWNCSWKSARVGCALAAVEDKEKIDHRREHECGQKLNDWALFAEGRVNWNAGGGPYSDNKADKREDVRVFRKPEPSAPPEDKEPDGAENQKCGV